MRKIVVHRPGGHDRLVVEEGPDPAPGPGEVAVSVSACGVNYADVMVRMGLYASAKRYVGWPITPGFEVAGTVAALGGGRRSARRRPGDRRHPLRWLREPRGGGALGGRRRPRRDAAARGRQPPHRLAHRLVRGARAGPSAGGAAGPRPLGRGRGRRGPGAAAAAGGVRGGGGGGRQPQGGPRGGARRAGDRQVGRAPVAGGGAPRPRRLPPRLRRQRRGDPAAELRAPRRPGEARGVRLPLDARPGPRASALVEAAGAVAAHAALQSPRDDRHQPLGTGLQPVVPVRGARPVRRGDGGAARRVRRREPAAAPGRPLPPRSRRRRPWGAGVGHHHREAGARALRAAGLGGRRRRAGAPPVAVVQGHRYESIEAASGDVPSLVAGEGAIAAQRTWVGISGWRYANWRGVFYPKGLPQRRELAYAAEQLDAVEINGSFYSLQRVDSWARWRDEVPDDFLFAVKGSRFITHMKKLKDPEAPLANFFAQGLLQLGPKLGPVLWQFPERMPVDLDRFAHFFSLLPHDTVAAAELASHHDHRLDGRAWLGPVARRPLRHAVEIRQPQLVTPALFDLLEAHGIAWVLADTAGRWPWADRVTADFAYLRLHGDIELYASGYSDEALDAWAERIRALAPRDVYVFFDNDAKVHAPFDALRLRERLAAPAPEPSEPEPPPDLPEPV